MKARIDLMTHKQDSKFRDDVDVDEESKVQVRSEMNRQSVTWAMRELPIHQAQQRTFPEKQGAQRRQLCAHLDAGGPVVYGGRTGRSG